MPAYPAFVGPSYVSHSSIADGERTVNWYVERLEVEGGSTQLALYPTPGVETLVTATTAPGRAHLVAKGREFAVIGTTFGEVSADGTTFTSRGTVAIDSSPATLSYNGDGGGQVFVTSGNNGYLFTLATNVFAQVRTGATAMGAHLDGYFLALDTATSTLFLSDLLNGATWDPTQFAQRSTAPDAWIAVKILDRYVYLFGSQTSEVWYNAGTFPFPFKLHPSGLIPYGIAAAFSATDVGGSLCWLAKTAQGQGAVLQASGFTPQVISTFALQVALGSYSTLSDAVGDTYEDLGHTFYVLTFPTANATWTYDATPTLQLTSAQKWAERGTWISESNRYDAWHPLYHAFVNGQHRMLDRSSGAIFRVSSDLGVDVESRPLRRLRRPPGLWAENQRLVVSEFAVDLETGVGLVTGQGSDPQISLRISRDGGKTWGSERWRSAGAMGEYTTRVRWVRCGSARHWVPELLVTDPIPWRVLGARVRVSGAQREAA